MTKSNVVKVVGRMPVRSRYITFVEFVDMTGVHPSRLGELIDLGWIDPGRTSDDQYLFCLADVYRISKLERLCRDFELSNVAGTIIVDLLERIECLEQKVRELERLSRL